MAHMLHKSDRTISYANQYMHTMENSAMACSKGKSALGSEPNEMAEEPHCRLQHEQPGIKQVCNIHDLMALSMQACSSVNDGHKFGIWLDKKRR